MNDLKLIINGSPVDLIDGTVVTITKQSAKIGEPSSVLASGTNEFILPPTPTNKGIFENADVFQSAGNVPYRKLTATLIQQGVETITDGFAVLNDVTGKGFAVQIIGGNASFFNIIKELNLRDLPLTEFDHFWTNQNVFDNRNNTDGFIYALTEQSSLEQDAPTPTLSTYGVNLYAVRTNLLMACFYLKTLVEKIHSAQNYTFVCDITALNIYDEMVVFNGENPNRGTDATYLNLKTFGNSDVDLDTDFITQSLFVPLLFDGSITEQQSIYWDEPTLNSDLLNGVSSGGLGMVGSEFSKLLFPDATRVSVVFNFAVENVNVGVPITLNIRAVHSNYGLPATVITRTYLLPDASTTNYSETFEFDATKSESNIYFNDGETGCLFFVYAVYSGVATLVTMKSGGDASFAFEFISPYLVSTTLPYNFLQGFTPIPDMLQTDLMKEVAKMFNLIFDTDTITRTVTAKRMDELVENITGGKDISAKLHDVPETIKMEFRLPNYAQKNILKWQPDNLTAFDGVGYLYVNDENLDGENVLVEMLFGATSPVVRFDTINAPYIPIFTGGEPTNGQTHRMLIIRPTEFPYNINFNRVGDIPLDIPTTTVSFAYFNEAGNIDSLDFPTLIPRFFNTVEAMLEKTKVINCLMNLNIGDVKDYSPFIPVYVSKFNSWFMLQQIDNYVEGKLTPCKLIKI